jgi:alkaline phosphatase D
MVNLEIGAGSEEATRSLTARATAADDLIVRVPLDGLAPGTRHRYQVTQGSERVEGAFTTAPRPDEPARVTFLWSGDLGGAGRCRPVGGEYAIFRAMLRQAGDFLVFAGDTIYADVACNRPETIPGANFRARTLGEYRARHRYNREDPAVQAFLRQTPVYATWDDHDVRNDFAGTTETLMPIGRQAFLDYWPVAAGAIAVSAGGASSRSSSSTRDSTGATTGCPTARARRCWASTSVAGCSRRCQLRRRSGRSWSAA